MQKKIDPLGDIISEYKKQYPIKLLKIIKKAMNPEQNNRYQRVEDIYKEIIKLVNEPPPSSNFLRNIMILFLLGGLSFLGYKIYTNTSSVYSIPIENNDTGQNELNNTEKSIVKEKKDSNKKDPNKKC